MTNEQIKTEIEIKKSDIKVNEIYKIKQSHLIKIQLMEHEMATLIKEKGLLITYFKMPPTYIDYERFIPMIQCMNCNDYGHIKRNCKKPELTLCSECGENTHTHSRCLNKINKKCTNCKGPHRTFSNKCLVRKAAMEEKRKEIIKIEQERRQINQETKKKNSCNSQCNN